MHWYLHACPVCSGDLHDDLQDRGWVVCFMCARFFKLVDLQAGSTIEAMVPKSTPVPVGVARAA
jgi:hypothetical protein